MRDLYQEWQEENRLDAILLLVKKWRADGAGLDEIAKKLKISRSTLFKYQNEHSDFADALKKGKEVVDAEVENSLKKECIGYYYEESTTTTTAIINERTGEITDLKRVETKTNKRYARPSPSAIAYYLNNRVPNKWKNRVVNVIEDTNDLDDTIKKMQAFFGGNENDNAE